jgi:hypothetical protein
MNRIRLIIGIALTTTFTTPTIADSDFECRGIGLRLTSDTAMLGDIVLKQCHQKGVWRTYAGDCTPDAKTEKLVFDEITLQIQLIGIDGEKKVLTCYRRR